MMSPERRGGSQDLDADKREVMGFVTGERSMRGCLWSNKMNGRSKEANECCQSQSCVVNSRAMCHSAEFIHNKA